MRIRGAFSDRSTHCPTQNLVCNAEQCQVCVLAVSYLFVQVLLHSSNLQHEPPVKHMHYSDTGSINHTDLTRTSDNILQTLF